MTKTEHTPVAFSNSTRRPFPSLPYDAIKNATLGESYELSLAFVGTSTMAKLNETYRHKEGSTDILSFELGEGVGQIVISPADAARKAPKFEKTLTEYFRQLFIHGCAHLKGMEHGATMEEYERRIGEQFGA